MEIRAVETREGEEIKCMILLSKDSKEFQREIIAVLKLNERRKSGSLTFRLVQERIAIGYSQMGTLPNTVAATNYVNDLKREVESIMNS